MDKREGRAQGVLWPPTMMWIFEMGYIAYVLLDSVWMTIVVVGGLEIAFFLVMLSGIVKPERVGFSLWTDAALRLLCVLLAAFIPPFLAWSMDLCTYRGLTQLLLVLVLFAYYALRQTQEIFVEQPDFVTDVDYIIVGVHIPLLLILGGALVSSESVTTLMLVAYIFVAVVGVAAAKHTPERFLILVIVSFAALWAVVGTVTYFTTLDTPRQSFWTYIND